MKLDEIRRENTKKRMRRARRFRRRCCIAQLIWSLFGVTICGYFGATSTGTNAAGGVVWAIFTFILACSFAEAFSELVSGRKPKPGGSPLFNDDGTWKGDIRK